MDRPFDVTRFQHLCRDHLRCWSFIYLPSVDSTNTYLRHACNAEPRDRTIVLADFQSSGRGRSGRTWAAPPNTSLLVSLATRLPIGEPPALATAVVSLAVTDALNGIGIEGGVKWPNDVVVRDRKLAGVLAERLGGGQTIVGCGVNMSWFPSADSAATCIDREAGRPVEREGFLATWVEHLDAWLDVVDGEPDAVMQEWRQRSATIGRYVTVHESGGSWSGDAVAIADDGALEVRDETGTVRSVYAGDVSVRPVLADFTRS